MRTQTVKTRMGVTSNLCVSYTWLKLAMPTRKRFDQERLQCIAEKAARTAELPNARCIYVPQDEVNAKRKSAAFEWQLRWHGRDHRHVVRTSVHHAAERGVPMPEAWRTASKCACLDEITSKHAREYSVQLGIELACTIVGQIATPTIESPMAGAIVSFPVLDGARANFLLCAHIEGGRWLCFPGTILECSIDTNHEPAHQNSKPAAALGALAAHGRGGPPSHESSLARLATRES